MTNEQLLLLKIAERQILLTAISTAHDLMPKDAPRDTIFGHPVEFTALGPFLELVEGYDEAIALLKMLRKDQGRAI